MLLWIHVLIFMTSILSTFCDKNAVYCEFAHTAVHIWYLFQKYLQFNRGIHADFVFLHS